MTSDPIANLIETYHSLNTTVVDELNTEPSALGFMRYVASNRPFVVRRAAADWTAVKNWDAAHLKRAMEGQKVRVAVTPLGNADAVVDTDDQGPIFVEPHEIIQDFSTFLDSVRTEHGNEDEETPTRARNVLYAQPQNDSLRKEYPSIFPEVPGEIGFAHVSLHKLADAINIWLGNDRSVTSLHKDNYENIYIQIRGQKHFVLLPPVEMPCVGEKALPRGCYIPQRETEDSDIDISATPLTILADLSGGNIPTPTWDPDNPSVNATAYSHLSQPLRVTLNEGDMLFLPAMWYHKVSQSRGDEGFVCAVNYWYDMEFAGSFWAANQFVRETVEAKAGEVE